MELKLLDKKVIVTGGTQGLGLGLVRGFLEEGCRVAFCSRADDNMRAVSDILSVHADRYFSHVADVSSDAQVAKFVEKAAKSLGGIDIVINNAGGIERYGDFLDLDLDDWNQGWQTNFMSAVHMVRHAYPYLKESPNGRILNVSSITALQPGTFNPHYSAAKAALINFSKHLANRLAGDNILVNTLVPGNFESGGWNHYLADFAKNHKVSPVEVEANQKQRVESGIPLGRMGTVEEIVPLVLLAASPVSAWMTGSCIVVDGGKFRAIH